MTPRRAAPTPSPPLIAAADWAYPLHILPSLVYPRLQGRLVVAPQSENKEEEEEEHHRGQAPAAFLRPVQHIHAWHGDHHQTKAITSQSHSRIHASNVTVRKKNLIPVPTLVTINNVVHFYMCCLYWLP